MTGPDLASRLLENIQTSLALRARIPYLDMLKELAQGGASIPTDTLNTSSNFGSFDSALREVLTILHTSNDSFLPVPEVSPLPLTAIHSNLSANFLLLTEVLGQTSQLFEPLEKINLASV